jgi:hypothetical protein
MGVSSCPDGLQQEENNQAVLDSDKNNRDFLKGLFIVSFIFTAIVWLVVIALRNRIRLSVAIFEEASSALRTLPQIFLMPFITNFCLVAYVAFWLLIFAYMLTRGDAVKDADLHANFQDRCARASARLALGVRLTRIPCGSSEDSNYEKQVWYLIFALFWNTQFLVACGQIIVAGAVAAW